jgi:hypothetical protein
VSRVEPNLVDVLSCNEEGSKAIQLLCFGGSSESTKKQFRRVAGCGKAAIFSPDEQQPNDHKFVGLLDAE